VLLTAPDRNNWSDYPNIWEEVLRLLVSCEWFEVYDIAEALWRAVEHDSDRQDVFLDELNRFFQEKGIGWELKAPDGIVFRGGEAGTGPSQTCDGFTKRCGISRDVCFPTASARFSTLWPRSNAPRAISSANRTRR
jgi:hypothetical protein